MLKHARFLALAAVAAASVSCGSAIRDGRSPVYLVVQSVQGVPGGTGTPTSGILDSDVITNRISPAPCSASSPCPTVFPDNGTAVLSTSLKNIGTPGNPSTPTSNNDVTITQYHVEYVRTDGRNTQGVDVPYAFDGATSGTIVAGGQQSFGFELVRSVAKAEAPLVQLTNSPSVLKMIANVTFYGHDQAGNQLSVTGSITIEFANFGDQS